MSGDDDTFDIDIYGDESNVQEKAHDEFPEDRLFDDDEQYGYDGRVDQTQTQNPQDNTNGNSDAQREQSKTTVPQGTKRKAPDDEEEKSQNPEVSPAQWLNPTTSTPSAQPTTADLVEPNATPSLKLHDLHWWTTEEDLRHVCAIAKVEDQLKDIAFGEHKINGKSRGEAYLEFSSPAAASAVKRVVEERDAPKEDGSEGKRKHPFQIYYVGPGNPFKGRDSGQVGKKDPGAYNAAPVRGGFNRGGGGSGGGGFQRGGFQGRGGGGSFQGGFQARGGGFQAQNQQNWNANGNMGGGGGGGGGSAMGMGGFNAGGLMGGMMNGMGGMGGMGMGGYNMMGGMGARGAFTGNMGNMMGMGGRGGNMMAAGARGGMLAGRGGWPGAAGGFPPGGAGGFAQGAGMQQGGGAYGAGYGGGGGGGANKKMRNE